MKKFISLLTTSLVLLFATSTVSATLIEGSISFTGQATTTGTNGTFLSPGAVSTVDFDTFNVDVVAGDFTPAVSVGDWVTFTDLVPAVAPTDALWSVGGFTFDLKTITLNAVVYGHALINGTGIVKNSAYDDTFFTWEFSSETNGTKTFSASAVPAPAGAALLGLGLLGFGFARRNKQA